MLKSPPAKIFRLKEKLFLDPVDCRHLSRSPDSTMSGSPQPEVEVFEDHIPTIREAHVSLGTASKALNGSGKLLLRE
jgi:hypothetical protein